MLRFNFQLELQGKLTTFSAEQLDDQHYLVRTFNHKALITITENGQPSSEDEVFNIAEIAGEIMKRQTVAL